jgi:hypothetical protein
MQELAELGAALGLEQGVPGPGLRVRGIPRLRDHVVVAAQHQRLLQAQQRLRMGDEPVHPGELVGEFRGAERIAVGQVDRGDAHHAAVGRDHAFEVARLLVRRVAGQAPAHVLERALREDRDAVVGLLPVGDDVVARALHLGARKALVDRLQLLEADHVGLGGFQHLQEVVESLLDRIDVPGGDPHR